MDVSDGNDQRKELEYISIDDIHHAKLRFVQTVTFQPIQKYRREQALQIKDGDCASYVFSLFVFVHVSFYLSFFFLQFSVQFEITFISHIKTLLIWNVNMACMITQIQVIHNY